MGIGSLNHIHSSTAEPFGESYVVLSGSDGGHGFVDDVLIQLVIVVPGKLAFAIDQAQIKKIPQNVFDVAVVRDCRPLRHDVTTAALGI